MTAVLTPTPTCFQRAPSSVGEASAPDIADEMSSVGPEAFLRGFDGRARREVATPEGLSA
jgi:hypothetical protein